MIKNIFLPNKIGDYYLFNKRIIGVEITQSFINIAKIVLSGRKITIEHIIQKKGNFSPNKEGSYEHVEIILSDLLSEVIPFDEIRYSLPSWMAIYKELKLPFIDDEKINMTINFELEPLLPFSLDTSVSSFIITKLLPDEKSSEIMTVTVQNSNIEKELTIFNAIGMNIDILTIDFIALYGLIKMIPTLHDDIKSIAFLDLGINTTRLMYIDKGQLRIVRSLAQGLKHLTHHINNTKSTIQETFMRVGFAGLNEQDQLHIKSSLNPLWSSVRIVLNTYYTDDKESLVDKIIILGEGSFIPGITDYIANEFSTTCFIFDKNILMNVPHIKINEKASYSPASLISIATAYPSPLLEHFNLKQNNITENSKLLFIKQISAALFLSLSIIFLMYGYYWIQISRMEKEIKQSSNEIITNLKKQFPRALKNETDLDEIVDIAKQEVAKEEETWFAFSLSSQSRFLQYLLELTSKIDKDALSFNIEKLTITQGTMYIQAQVKNYEALKILERELRQSPLFSYIEPQDTPNFTMKILLAPIPKD